MLQSCPLARSHEPFLLEPANMKNSRIYLAPDLVIALVVTLFLVSVSAQAQDMRADRVYPRFAVGVTGIFVTIEKGLKVTVADVQANTPAAGQFQKGDVLVSIGGMDLAVSQRLSPHKGICEGSHCNTSVCLGTCRSRPLNSLFPKSFKTLAAAMIS